MLGRSNSGSGVIDAWYGHRQRATNGYANRNNAVPSGSERHLPDAPGVMRSASLQNNAHHQRHHQRGDAYGNHSCQINRSSSSGATVSFSAEPAAVGSKPARQLKKTVRFDADDDAPVEQPSNAQASTVAVTSTANDERTWDWWRRQESSRDSGVETLTSSEDAPNSRNLRRQCAYPSFSDHVEVIRGSWTSRGEIWTSFDRNRRICAKLD